MAVSFLAREVSDLCLGKPPLRSILVSATVADALSVIKRSGEINVSVWSCDHSKDSDYHEFGGGACRCVGKVCMVDVISFLSRKENVSRPADALQSPVSDLLPKSVPAGLVRHLESNASLLEAIDHMLEGAQNLVIPIQSYSSSNSSRKLIRKPSSSDITLHNGQEYCWLTQEDVLRFLLDCIGVFSPIPTFTIESLDIIDRDIMTVHYNAPASSILHSISRAHTEQTSIAVIDNNNSLIGEISPFTLASCDETVAAAIATLSASDLMAYIDSGGPPENLVQLVRMRLQEKNLEAVLDMLEEISQPSLSSSSSCSSEEEFGLVRQGSLARYYAGRRSEAIVCYPWSSLMAVTIQALTHRVSCIWVVEESYNLVGMVTFTGMLQVFRSVVGVQYKGEGENTLQ